MSPTVLSQGLDNLKWKSTHFNTVWGLWRAVRQLFWHRLWMWNDAQSWTIMTPGTYVLYTSRAQTEPRVGRDEETTQPHYKGWRAQWMDTDGCIWDGSDRHTHTHKSEIRIGSKWWNFMKFLFLELMIPTYSSKPIGPSVCDGVCLMI